MKKLTILFLIFILIIGTSFSYNSDGVKVIVLNYHTYKRKPYNLDDVVNKWLSENHIDIIDIQFTIGGGGGTHGERSQVMIIYREKK